MDGFSMLLNFYCLFRGESSCNDVCFISYDITLDYSDRAMGMMVKPGSGNVHVWGSLCVATPLNCIMTQGR
jgi:hypothetical protein